MNYARTPSDGHHETTFSRAFSMDDQRAFAELSGDWNPLHIDALFARRTAFGHVVVHGVHASLWAVESALARIDGAFPIKTIDAQYFRAIPVDVPVACTLNSIADGVIELVLSCQGSTASQIRIEQAVRASRAQAVLAPSHPPREEVQNWTIDNVAGAGGSIPLHLDVAAATLMFPKVVQSIPLDQLAVLLATSRVVGMKSPGLYSLFSSLRLDGAEGIASSMLDYRVAKLDKRFRQLEIGLTCQNFTGRITAFLRKPPQRQRSFSELRQFVSPDEFKEQKAVVVGGSRGLGEVAAKLLAAGGADVIVTYRQGKDDALGVTEDICSSSGRARCCQLDVQEPRADAFPAGWRPTHLYYFATPSYLPGAGQAFSWEAFQTFCFYYLEGFSRTFEALRHTGMSLVFYPSTVAIDEVPQGMAEYAAAKAAAEILCRSIEKANPGLSVFTPRLPRLATDQTVGLLPLKTSEPAPVILDLLRSARELQRTTGG